MTNEQLAVIITEFINSDNGRAMCRRFQVDPDDAIPEIYLKLSKKNLSAVTCPEHWVCRCSRRVLIDMRRKANRQNNRRQMVGESFFDNLAAVARDTTQDSKYVRAIQKLIEQLPDNEKAAFMVKVARSGESYGSLAKHYGVTRSTAAGWAKRAVNKLRRWLKEGT